MSGRLTSLMAVYSMGIGSGEKGRSKSVQQPQSNKLIHFETALKPLPRPPSV